MKEKKTPEMLRAEAKEIVKNAKGAAKKKLDEADRLERAKMDHLVQKIVAAGKVAELEKFTVEVCGDSSKKPSCEE